MTDFTLYNHGSVCVLTPKTSAAFAWIEENLDSDGLRWGYGGRVIEPRYVEDILTGADMAGLTVSL